MEFLRSYSTETALVRVRNNVLLVNDCGQWSWYSWALLLPLTLLTTVSLYVTSGTMGCGCSVRMVQLIPA